MMMMMMMMMIATTTTKILKAHFLRVKDPEELQHHRNCGTLMKTGVRRMAVAVMERRIVAGRLLVNLKKNIMKLTPAMMRARDMNLQNKKYEAS